MIDNMNRTIEVERIEPVLAVKWDGSQEAFAEIKELSLKSDKFVSDKNGDVLTIVGTTRPIIGPPSTESTNVYIGDYVFLDKNQGLKDEGRFGIIKNRDIGTKWRVVEEPLSHDFDPEPLYTEIEKYMVNRLKNTSEWNHIFPELDIFIELVRTELPSQYEDSSEFIIDIYEDVKEALTEFYNGK